MRNLRRLTASILIFVLMFSLCACRISLPEPVEISTADEAAAMGFSAGDYRKEMSVGDYAFFDVNIKIDYEYAVKWSSSNPEVAVVDSNGRVDALSPGKVTITASAKRSRVDYEVVVNKASKATLSDTTAFTDNDSQLKQNMTDNSGENIYALLVNSAKNCVTAYTYNASGVYNVHVRAMVCSVGKEVPDDTFRVSSREQWLYTDKYNYQYATYFGECAFTSAPYKGYDPATLVAEEYNKLGENCTGTRIWLSASDAKWIYDNCNDETLVKVAHNALIPMGIPEAVSLGDNAKSRDWDPTDPDENNPYRKLAPYFDGIKDEVVAVGGTFDVYEGVTAFDTCGNKLTDKFTVDGTVLCSKEGEYIITYTYTDSLNRTGRADRTVKVVSQEEYEALQAETE